MIIAHHQTGNIYFQLYQLLIYIIWPLVLVRSIQNLLPHWKLQFFTEVVSWLKNCWKKSVVREGGWADQHHVLEGRVMVGLNRISDSENFERETSATIKWWIRWFVIPVGCPWQHLARLSRSSPHRQTIRCAGFSWCCSSDGATTSAWRWFFDESFVRGGGWWKDVYIIYRF